MAEPTKPAAQNAAPSPKAPGRPAPAPAKPGAAPQKPAKAKKKASGALIVALVFVLLIAATAGLVYFDIAGLKTKAVSIFKFEDPTKEQLAAVEQKKKELDDREKTLADAETAQKAQLKDIKAREKAVADKEAAAAEKDKTIADLHAQLDALKTQLNIKTIDIASAVKMFAGMDPKNAAKAMSSMKDPAQIALLLLYMDADKSAAILNQMKPALASSVMTEIASMKASGQLKDGTAGSAQTPPAPSATPQPSGG